MSKFVCAAVATAMCCLLSAASAQSSTPTSTLSYIPNTRIRPFPYLQSSNYALLTGASINIEFGYAMGADQLLLDYQGEFDITAVFQASEGILWLSGTAPTSVYMSAISSVIFSTNADDGQQRRITWSFGQNVIFSQLTGHYYEFNKHTTTWNTSLATCENRKMFGLQGYLATISSADEMASVGGKGNYTAYIGGADIGVEGNWMWESGPEKGTKFWTGKNQYKGGKDAPRMYSDWARFQPNNGGAATNPAENFLAIEPSTVPGVAYFTDKVGTGAAAGYICEYGGMDNDEVTATYGEFSNSVVLHFACDLFTSASECTNNAAYGCAFSGVSCVQLECTTHRKEGACMADWRCQWSVSGMIGKCGTTRCGKYSNRDSCAADDQCTQTSTGGVDMCKPAQCADRQSTSTCTQLSGCQWLSGQCMSTTTLGCADQDTVYMVDGSGVMGSEWNRLTTGFQGLTDMLSIFPWSINGVNGQKLGFVQYGPNSMLDARDQVSPDAAGKLRTSPKDVAADIEFMQNRFSTASSGSRQIAPALNTAIAMLNSETSTARKKVIVIFSAGAISDAAAIASSPSTAAMLNGITVIGYAIKPSTQISNQGTAAVNSLKLLTPNVWQTSIMDIMTMLAYQCINAPSTPGAAIIGTSTWPPAAAASACLQYWTDSMCSANPDCAWDDAARVCSPTACMGNTAAGCKNSCSMAGSSCKQRCAQQTTSTDCTNSANTMYCTWDSTNSGCVDKNCIANPSEDSCIADTNSCRWIGSTIDTTAFPFVKTPGRCEEMVCEAITDSSMCNTNCVWLATEKCVKNICQYTTRQTCEATTVNGQCMWGDDGSGCGFSLCGKATSEYECGKTVQCQWSVATAPGMCVAAKCTGENLMPNSKQANCMALQQQLECSWDQSSQLCNILTCDMIASSDMCARRTDCIWRNDACKDTRFVQCPGIDLVIAVEATKVMGETFGRHPSGYMGIMEQLRMWGLEMPFSVGPDATGFRVQLQLYGSNTAATFPSDTNMYPFSNSSQTGWATGPSNYVSKARQYFESASNVPNSTNVQLVGSLKAALATFQQNQGPRTRVMVVIGHSPIGDNSAVDLTNAIVSLENVGVQIFTNLVRRFSAITSSEQIAANRLAPFSTDPRSTHFSFTTIDTMRTQLLDKFCDPSSTVGAAIGISRDRTLPCNWLNGKTECNVQGSCIFNSTASITCPLASQCPQLGCMELPSALSKLYDCKHCEIVNGAFKCSTGNTFPIPTGLCLTDKCMWNNATQCGGAAGCWWDSSKTKCVRDQCSAYNSATDPRTSCNNDLACVYVDAGLTGGPTLATCKRSACGLYRAAGSCNAQFQLAGTKNWKECYYNTAQSPAICQESRCSNSNQANCVGGCYYSSTNGRSCYIQTCRYNNQPACEMDASCYWNPDNEGTVDLQCQPKGKTCKLAKQFSSWSTCTSTCAWGVQYRIRAIYSVNEPDETSCADVAAQDPINGVTTLVETMRCASKSTAVCSTYCSSLATAECAKDISCMSSKSSTGAVTCVPRANSPCGSLGSVACGTADSCTWHPQYNFCFANVTQCKSQASTPTQCANFNLCSWNSGANNNMDAASWGIPSQLVNPGQKAILLFPTVRFESNDMITGATVSIESNYSRGSDILELSYKTLNATFSPSGGVLFIKGSATVTEYINALRQVTFFTTATSKDTRLITWSLGENTLYSGITGHFYKAFTAETSYSGAVSACSSMAQVWGRFGYLATVGIEHENTLLSIKLDSQGFISGEDRSQGQWRVTTGPNANAPFWSGGPYFAGGRPAANMYANWANDQPMTSKNSFSNAYLDVSGYWVSMNSTSKAQGYFCEFGGLSTDTGFASYTPMGATTVSAGGCIPTPCTYHQIQSDCQRDPECTFTSSGLCQVGCTTFSSAGDCSRQAHCKWDTNTVPASCALNVCQSAGKTDCNGATLSGTCTWSEGTGCLYRTGCAVYTTDATCSAITQCFWSRSVGTSAASCNTKPCDKFSGESTCGLNAQCEWNAINKACVSTVCKTGDQTMCKSDRRCTWQDGMGGTAVQFTPGGTSVVPFASGVPVANDITNNCSGITVSITQGFQKGSDLLFVKSEDNIAGNYKIAFNRETGVLVAMTVPGVVLNRYQCYQFLTTAIRFFSTSNTVNSRRLSYTLGANMVLSETNDKLFGYVNTQATSYTAASAVCTAQASQWGYTNGMVAQVFGQVDNLRLRALGAQGWLSATVQSGTNNWYWPGANGNKNFWEGVGASGTLPQADNYAQWAGGEPRGATAGTSRAFLVSSGFWKVVAGGASTPTGVICQFDVPQVVVAGGRNVAPYGCFMSNCLDFTYDICRQDPACVWKDANNGSQVGGQCALDTWCTAEKVPTACSKRELCYWDYDLGTCRTAPASKCSAKTDSVGCKGSGCSWMDASEIVPRSTSQSGVCIFPGCASNPAESSCTANPLCRWASNSLTAACVPRLCGYLSDSQCWSDKMCQWDALVTRCIASGCLAYGPNDAGCSSANSCAKTQVNNAWVCGYARCSTTLGGTAGKAACQDSDSSCLWNTPAGTCGTPGCDQYVQEKDCNADASCYFTYNPNRCLAAQCTSNDALANCELGVTETAKKPCIWSETTKTCRQPTFAEQNAPSTNNGVCQKEEYGNLVWLWLLAALILIMIIAIFYRLYLAYKHGLSFFEPARNTKTFSPHAGVGLDVFEEANGEETNVMPSSTAKYTRPTADEL